MFVGVSAFCIISCEGEKVQTPVVKDTPCPEWNTWAIFYRKDPFEKPITVQASRLDHLQCHQ